MKVQEVIFQFGSSSVR